MTRWILYLIFIISLSGCQSEESNSVNTGLSTNERLEELEREKQRNDEALQSFMAMLSIQTKEIDNLRQKFGQLQNGLNLQQPNNQTQQGLATSDSIFLATISVYEYSVSDQEPIIWDTAPINPGGHYSTVTGGYTVPVNGYYQFSVAKCSNEYQSWFWFLVDNTRYARHVLSSTGSTPATCATINLQLTAGQIVRVENQQSSIIYGTEDSGVINSWFTGHLLYAL